MAHMDHETDGGHVGQAADGDRQPTRHPDGAHRIGNVLAARCGADARHPCARRRLDVHDARRRVRDVRQAEWPARRRSLLASLNWAMLMATRQTPTSKLQFRAMGSAEPWTLGSEGYPLAAADGRDVQGPAALRPPASARPVHGARRGVGARAHRQRRRLAVRGARRRAGDRTGRIPASAVGDERSARADRAPLAGRHTRHLRRPHRRRVHPHAAPRRRRSSTAESRTRRARTSTTRGARSTRMRRVSPGIHRPTGASRDPGHTSPAPTRPCPRQSMRRAASRS